MSTFLKDLKLFCRVRGENYQVWKAAYKTMPITTKQNFRKDIAKFAKVERSAWN